MDYLDRLEHQYEEPEDENKIKISGQLEIDVISASPSYAVLKVSLVNSEGQTLYQFPIKTVGRYDSLRINGVDCTMDIDLTK